MLKRRQKIAHRKAQNRRTKTLAYDVAEPLRTTHEIAAYLNAWLTEAPGDAAGIARECRQEIAFGRGELHHLVVPYDDVPVRLHDQVFQTDRVGVVDAGHAAQHRLDARHELARAERLRDVIIGAERETPQPIGFVYTRRQHDDGDGRFVPQRFGDVQAVHVR